MSRKDNDMKKNYENPKVEIIEIGMNDVIITSIGEKNDSQIGGGTKFYSLEDDFDYLVK